ncbi:MAG TPA: hypothetical protein VN025_17935 [Candidatus Dormibacteraeota bacterium]|jgi:hypothetical protein|nr:hypothetical protein [Candidatus Dormibacteraeota bacterium]
MNNDELTEEISRGVSITKQKNKFVVYHRYQPKPDVQQPTTFDDEVITKVGEADTIEKAEKIKREYEKKLSEAAEDEEDDD